MLYLIAVLFTLVAGLIGLVFAAFREMRELESERNLLQADLLITADEHERAVDRVQKTEFHLDHTVNLYTSLGGEVREMQDEIERLKAENKTLRGMNVSLRDALNEALESILQYKAEISKLQEAKQQLEIEKAFLNRAVERARGYISEYKAEIAELEVQVPFNPYAGLDLALRQKDVFVYADGTYSAWYKITDNDGKDVWLSIMYYSNGKVKSVEEDTEVAEATYRPRTYLFPPFEGCTTVHYELGEQDWINVGYDTEGRVRYVEEMTVHINDDARMKYYYFLPEWQDGWEDRHHNKS